MPKRSLETSPAKYNQDNENHEVKVVQPPAPVSNLVKPALKRQKVFCFNWEQANKSAIKIQSLQRGIKARSESKAEGPFEFNPGDSTSDLILSAKAN